MFRHKVTYVDFNGTEREEDLYFHLSTPEVVRLEAELGMPMEDYVKSLASNMDMKTLLSFLETIVLRSYGQKTIDGRSFHKSKELRDEFEHSHAYAELFEDILTNPDLAQRFGAAVAEKSGAKKNQVSPQVVSD